MGASGNVVPCIIRLSSFGSDNKPVVFEEKLTLESLRDWAAGVKSGKYKYVPKSEPVPAENSGPVKGKDRASSFSWFNNSRFGSVLVGKNWNDIVNDASKHVLVEFYGNEAPSVVFVKSFFFFRSSLVRTLQDACAKVRGTGNQHGLQR